MTGRLDACLVAVVGFAVVFLLRQETFYKDDGHVYLTNVLEGQLQHPHHMLYKPLVSWLHRAIAWTGASAYDAAVAASALGTAIGLGCASLATRRLGLTRGAALCVPALMLSVPALLFFATVVELHGVFLGFAGPSFVAVAALACAPSLGTGAALGVTLALAYVGHASAGLLPVALLPLALFYPEGGAPGAALARARCLFVPALVAGATFGAFLLLLPVLGRWSGLGVDTGSAAAYVARDAFAFASDAGRWVSTLFFEWLAPYAPLNLLALAACVVGRRRAQARWLTLAVVPYYLVCVFLLPGAEFGAYLTPMAWPLALLALRAAPARLVVLLGCVGFAGGVSWVQAHDRPDLARRFAAGVRAAAAGRAPCLLLGDHAEVKATLIALPDVPHFLVLYAGAVPEPEQAAVLRQLDGLLQMHWEQGRAVLLTDGAARMLEAIVPSGPRVVAAMQARYRLERVEIAGPDGAFAGWRVTSR